MPAPPMVNRAFGDFLTSSTRTPKFISKQWSDTLMPFHKHSPIDSLLALRQCHLYSHYSFSKFEHLVHTHIYAGQFQQTLQFLVNFQGHEADTDMGFYPAPCEVKHWSYLNL